MTVDKGEPSRGKFFLARRAPLTDPATGEPIADDAAGTEADAPREPVDDAVWAAMKDKRVEIERRDGTTATGKLIATEGTHAVLMSEDNAVVSIPKDDAVGLKVAEPPPAALPTDPPPPESTTEAAEDEPKDEAWPLVEAAGKALPSFADRPVFIGWGLKDFVFDRHSLERFQADLPRAQVHAFEDAGHYVLEDKHEVLVPAIRRFLETHPV